jgi:hypothetical protein
MYDTIIPPAVYVALALFISTVLVWTGIIVR